MVMVSSRLRKRFETTAPPERVMELLGELPEAARHMPNVEKVEAGPEPGAYTYTLEKIGAGPISMQVWYRSVFSVKPEDRRVSWEPVEGVGNSMARGSWTVSPRDEGSLVELDSEFGANMPVPRIMKGAAEGFLDREYNRVLDTYCANLKATLDGGDGRMR